MTEAVHIKLNVFYVHDLPNAGQSIRECHNKQPCRNYFTEILELRSFSRITAVSGTLRTIRHIPAALCRVRLNWHRRMCITVFCRIMPLLTIRCRGETINKYISSKLKKLPHNAEKSAIRSCSRPAANSAKNMPLPPPEPTNGLKPTPHKDGERPHAVPDAISLSGLRLPKYHPPFPFRS